MIVRYFVHTPDGQRYGPADIGTLSEWVMQGRVLSNFILEEETSGRRVVAESVPGLDWDIAGPQVDYPPTQWSQPPTGGFGAYAGSGYADPSLMAQTLNRAWTWAVLSITCCPLIGGALGLMYSLRARDMGHPSYRGPLILSAVGLALSVIGIIFNR